MEVVYYGGVVRKLIKINSCFHNTKIDKKPLDREL